MKKDFISQVETKTPLQREYDLTGRIPTSNNYDLESEERWSFNFNSMRMVNWDAEFSKIFSLFGKQVKRYGNC